MFEHRNDRLGSPYVNPIDQGVRADEIMRAADGRVGTTSGRSRFIAGWTIALAIVGFLVAALAGWIDIVPG